MKNKVALVSGCTGQDAAYLSEFLLDKGYRVIGGSRRGAERTYWRLKHLDIDDKVEIVDFDLLDSENMRDVIRKYKPDEIYNLAAMSFVGTSFRQPRLTLLTNGVAVCDLLEIVRQELPKCRFYQASTSELYGTNPKNPQDEDINFLPASPYGYAKMLAHNACRVYRESYGMFVSCGILFNHESPLRGEEFVTQKIANYVKTLIDQDKPLELGNMYAKRDWGFAGDYVKAMWKMMQLDSPDDFVVATGETHTVKEFIEEAFGVVGIELRWVGEGIDEVGYDKKTDRVLVKISEKFYRPNEVDVLLGDSSKAQKTFGWKPEVSFRDLVRMMVVE